MIVFMKNCFLLIAIASFLLGCSGNKKENTLQDEEGTPVINLSSDNVSKVALLPLSEAAAKVEIVSLEVTDESLIGEITKMKVTDSDIWVKHYKDNHVLRFSRSGKFLNKVGKVGQGPEEYIRMADFFVDENTKEVYIQTTIVGVKVYDYEGNYKRTAAKTSPDDVFMTMYFQFALYDNKFFIAQNLAFINKPTPKDSVWSFAWVDSTYQKKKIFLKSATKLFSVLLASKRPLITELADKLRLKYPLLPTISPCPTMRLEAIRSIIPISCRRYPKSV